MAEFTFPYCEDAHGNAFATITVHLERPASAQSMIPIEGVIDTGAMYSILRAEYADVLGIPVERGRKVLVQGIGTSILCYAHTLTASVGGHSFPVTVLFSRQFKFATNLFGQNGFFDRHVITFDKKHKTVQLNEYA